MANNRIDFWLKDLFYVLGNIRQLARILEELDACEVEFIQKELETLEKRVNDLQ